MEGRFWRTLAGRRAGRRGHGGHGGRGGGGHRSAGHGGPAGRRAGLVGSPATAAEWRAVHLDELRRVGPADLRVLIVGDSLALTVAVGMAPLRPVLRDRPRRPLAHRLRRGHRPAPVGPRRGRRPVRQLPDVAGVVERRRAPAAPPGRRSGHRLLGGDGPRGRRALAAPRRPRLRRLRDRPARAGRGHPVRPAGPRWHCSPRRTSTPASSPNGEPVAPGRPGPGGPAQPAPGRGGRPPPRAW